MTTEIDRRRRQRQWRWAAPAGFAALVLSAALWWRHDGRWWLLPICAVVGAKALYEGAIYWRVGLRRRAVPFLLLALLANAAVFDAVAWWAGH